MRPSKLKTIVLASSRPSRQKTGKPDKKPPLLRVAFSLLSAAVALDFCGKYWLQMKACAAEAALAAASFIIAERAVTIFAEKNERLDAAAEFLGVPFVSLPIYALGAWKLRPIDAARFNRYDAGQRAGPGRIARITLKCLGAEIALNQCVGVGQGLAEDGGESLVRPLREALGGRRVRGHVRPWAPAVPAALGRWARRRRQLRAEAASPMGPPLARARHGGPRLHDPPPPGLRGLWGRRARRAAAWMPSWLPRGDQVLEDAVVPALCEEAFFRVLLFRRLDALVGKLPAQAASAVLFAWAHEYTSTRIFLEAEALHATGAALCRMVRDTDAACRTLEEQMEAVRRTARSEGLAATLPEIASSAVSYVPFGWWSAEAYVQSGLTFAAPVAMHFTNNYLALCLENLFAEDEY